jgi:hypothetical protein
MRSLFLLGASLCALLGFDSSSTPTNSTRVVEEYEGLYTVTTDEDHFVPCGVPGVGDGWALKFNNPRQAIFIGRQTVIRGYPPLTHFIRVRGTLDSAGRYNRGFQTHQLTVDTVLEVKETPQACPTYEDVPQPWSALPISSQLRGATFSADGRLAAVMNGDGRIGIWRVDRGRMVKNFASTKKVDQAVIPKTPMAFSADGQLLFVGNSDGKIRVWRSLTGKLLYTLSRTDSIPGYNDVGRSAMVAMRQLSLNKSGTLLAATSGWVTRIWSLKTRKPVTELNRRMAGLTRTFFADDGSLLVADENGNITSYREPGAPPQWSAKTGARNSQYATRSPDGKWIAFNAWGDSLFLWSVTDKTRGPALDVPTSFGGDGAIAFSPDGKIVATSGGMNGLYLWDTKTGAPIRSFQKYPGPVWHAWFLPDGKSIVTHSWNDGPFRIINLDSRGSSAGPIARTDSMAVIMQPPANQPRTVGGTVTGPNQRGVPDAEVLLMNGDAPDSVVQRAVTSPGGYFSFNGVRFPHVMVRVRKPGFQDYVMYMHQRRYDLGPAGIELKPAS